MRARDYYPTVSRTFPIQLVPHPPALTVQSSSSCIALLSADDKTGARARVILKERAVLSPRARRGVITIGKFSNGISAAARVQRSREPHCYFGLFALAAFHCAFARDSTRVFIIFYYYYFFFFTTACRFCRKNGSSSIGIK